jgi:hypothetical protein
MRRNATATMAVRSDVEAVRRAALVDLANPQRLQLCSGSVRTAERRRIDSKQELAGWCRRAR